MKQSAATVGSSSYFVLFRSLRHKCLYKRFIRVYKTAQLLLPDAINVSFPELYYDRGNHHEFVSLVKDLARPGELTQSQTFDFEFTHVEKPYESYTGQNVKLR